MTRERARQYGFHLHQSRQGTAQRPEHGAWYFTMPGHGWVGPAWDTPEEGLAWLEERLNRQAQEQWHNTLITPTRKKP